MPEPEALDGVFHALANAHRREIVRFLGQQPAAIHHLAQLRGLSLPAINKHIGVLEGAGLIKRHKKGRTTFLTLDPAPVALLQHWAAQFHTLLGHRRRDVRELRPVPDRHHLAHTRLRPHEGFIVKKFLVLTYGFTTPTDEVQQAWGAWFASVGAHLIDPGSPFGRGVELTHGGRDRTSASTRPSPLVGYCILNADDLAHAESLVSSMPIIDSVRIYEAHSM